MLNMEDDKVIRSKGERGNDAFLTYLGVDGKLIEVWVEIISAAGFMIKFKTEKNIISIPYTRVIRIKERL